MQNIFWVDMEMTGLDPKENVIIEFAHIITDLKLNPLDQYHAVIYQPQSELDKMDEWNMRTHGESGLTAKIPQGKPLAEVESEVIDRLKHFFPEEKPILAGNSIHQDRKFIDTYTKRLASLLHYRMIDVSSFKQIYKHCFQLTYQKETPHRALDDIQASIDELKFYMSYVNLPPQ